MFQKIKITCEVICKTLNALNQNLEGRGINPTKSYRLFTLLCYPNHNFIDASFHVEICMKGLG